jgi:hypothetical protein
MSKTTSVIIDDAFDVLDNTLAQFRPDLKGFACLFVKATITKDK